MRRTICQIHLRAFSKTTKMSPKKFYVFEILFYIPLFLNVNLQYFFTLQEVIWKAWVFEKVLHKFN